MIASSVINSGLGFIYWVFAARILTVDEVGLGSAVVASMTLVSGLSNGGLNYVAARFLPMANLSSRKLARFIQIVTALTGAVGAGIFLVGSAIWAEHVGQLGFMFIVATSLAAVFSVQDHVLLGLNQAKWIPVNNGLFGVGKLTLLLAAGWLVDAPTWQIVLWPWWIFLAISVVFCGVLVERFTSTGGQQLTDAQAIPPLPEVARFALINHIGGVLLQLPPLVYPIMVLQMLGSESAAYFFTAWMIASLLLFASSSIAAAMVAQASAPAADLRLLLSAGIRYTLLLVLPGVVVLVALGRWVLSIFGDDYQQGYGLLIILSLGCLIFPVNAFFAGLMRVHRLLKPVMVQGLLSGAVTLALAWPLGSAFGLEGFGSAFVIGQVVAAIGVVAQAKSLNLLPKFAVGSE